MPKKLRQGPAGKSGLPAIHSEPITPGKSDPQTMTLKLMTRSLIISALILLLAAIYAYQCGPSAGPRAEVLTSGSFHGISAYDVISWAHLDDILRHHLDQIESGEADGKCILAEYVIVQNGAEITAFIREHGYQSFRGPMTVRKRGTSMEVDVEITGRDGAKTLMILFADGTMQGVG